MVPLSQQMAHSLKTIHDSIDALRVRMNSIEDDVGHWRNQMECRLDKLEQWATSKPEPDDEAFAQAQSVRDYVLLTSMLGRLNALHDRLAAVEQKMGPERNLGPLVDIPEYDPPPGPIRRAQPQRWVLMNNNGAIDDSLVLPDLRSANLAAAGRNRDFPGTAPHIPQRLTSPEEIVEADPDSSRVRWVVVDKDGDRPTQHGYEVREQAEKWAATCNLRNPLFAPHRVAKLILPEGLKGEED